VAIVHPAPPNAEFWETLVRGTNGWVSFPNGLKRTQVSAAARNSGRLSSCIARKMVGGRDRDRIGDPCAKLIRKHDLVVSFSLAVHGDLRFLALICSLTDSNRTQVVCPDTERFFEKIVSYADVGQVPQGSPVFAGKNGWPSVTSSSEITSYKPTSQD
jgi:hypothetical protein